MEEHEVHVTRPEKVLFPEDALTKQQLIDYYRRVAPLMLPYLRDRPLVMQRFPDGISGQGFYQKAVAAYYPKWIERVSVKKAGGTVQHAVCNNMETLIYLANQAAIAFHIWLSRVDKIRFPDMMAFDLDPSGDDFSLVVQTARSLKQLLDELSLPAYLKTTGSRGLHVVVPLDAKHDFDEVRQFSRAVAETLIANDPDRLTLEQSKSKRGGRLLLDVNRNAYAQTFVAPYSIRARAGAPISMPLGWTALSNKRLRPDGFTVHNAFEHIKKDADPWKDFANNPGALDPARRKLGALKAPSP